MTTEENRIYAKEGMDRKMENTLTFNYEKMAQEAERECNALQARLAHRKAHPPLCADEDFRWRRENSILYDMYLEQRHNQRLFVKRARERGQL